MNIDPSLLQVVTHTEAGYRPLVDFADWRVAVLNFCDELRPENLTRMQRHDETDEVFVLLQGRCILLVGDGRDVVGNIQGTDLQPRTLYNVRRGVWHTHALNASAMVLVIENRDTTYDNSPFCPLSPVETAGIVTTAARLWEDGAVQSSARR
jgi:hypothetical protein